jgi:sterol desaturase/sphingolipid hydroxylase (fatty acid hydroxylase superfamily)
MLRATFARLSALLSQAPTSPWIPLAVYLPLAVLGMVWGATILPAWAVAGLVCAGLVLWTLLEYLLHSLAFHRTIAWLRLDRVQTSHAQHHAQPAAPEYLIGQLSFSLPVAIGLFGLLWLAFGSASASAATTAGAMLGYLAYELVHHRIHQRNKSRWLPRFLVKHHMCHHYKDDTRCYGVTTPLWDWVFGTTWKPATKPASGLASEFTRKIL